MIIIVLNLYIYFFCVLHEFFLVNFQEVKVAFRLNFKRQLFKCIFI